MKVLCVTLVSAVGLIGAGSALAVTDFVTPKRSAYCGTSEGELPLRLICWRPSDGLTVSMTRSVSVEQHVSGANRGYFDPAPGRLLHIGQSWRQRSLWTCVSRANGLTCANRSGHGWWLGTRRGSRRF